MPHRIITTTTGILAVAAILILGASLVPTHAQTVTNPAAAPPSPVIIETTPPNIYQHEHLPADTTAGLYATASALGLVGLMLLLTTRPFTQPFAYRHPAPASAPTAAESSV